MSELSLMTFNIANPSPERAQRQLDWLAARDEKVLALTETKDSAGCRLLADAFTTAGYHVAYPKPDNGDYGVMIVSKLAASTDDFGGRVGYLPSRTAAITLPAPGGPIHIIGAYVPSRDASAEKTERKRKWLAACREALASRPAGAAVFLGDLNVLEPGHQPHYPFFAPFEYDFYRQLTDVCGLLDAFRTLYPDTVEHSWVGRTDDGYRYDHAHCTADLASNLLACDYVHQPRRDRLSDHSALSVRLAVDPGEQLITSDPAAASAPPTLFSP
jgi:exodeoxyribonuclease III